MTIGAQNGERPTNGENGINGNSNEDAENGVNSADEIPKKKIVIVGLGMVAVGFM